MSRDVRVPRTPPIYAEGIFVCYPPYDSVVDINTVYIVEAIRSFPEMERRKRDVFAEVYEPHKLSETIYKEDAAAHAAIITLKAVDGTLLFIPNTYIESYPGMAGLEYSRNVVIVDVGMIPSTIDLKLLVADLQDVITKNVGATVDSVVDTMRYEGNITHEEHVALETARRLKIQQHIPLQQQVDEATQRTDEMQRQMDELVELIEEIQPTN